MPTLPTRQLVRPSTVANAEQPKQPTPKPPARPPVRPTTVSAAGPSTRPLVPHPPTVPGPLRLGGKPGPSRIACFRDLYDDLHNKLERRRREMEHRAIEEERKSKVELALAHINKTTIEKCVVNGRSATQFHPDEG